MNLKYFFFISLTFVACQSSISEEDKKILNEAAQIHLAAIKIEKELKPQFDQLIQKKNQLVTKGEELTDAENIFIAKVDQIQASYDFVDLVSKTLFRANIVSRFRIGSNYKHTRIPFYFI